MPTAAETNTQQRVADFFISYTGVDRGWAEWIAWELEEVGYTTVLQAWDFRPGSNFVLDMLRAAEAQRTIAVLSPDYLTGLYTQAEWAAAFVQDPTSEHGVLLPVRVRACDVPRLLSPIVCIDLVGLEAEVAKEQLLVGVRRERAKPSRPPGFPGTGEPLVAAPPRFPGALPSIWNVPYLRNPSFTGRKDFLTQLAKELQAERPVTLTGLGGVGKTQLAIEHAYRHAADYGLVWWLPAEEQTTLAAQFAELARELRLPERHEKDEAVQIAAVRRWLRQHPGWLLIFDNATEPAALDRYLPQSATGRVPITSRNANWHEVASLFPVELLPREEAVALLLRVTGQPDAAVAERLAELLGDLPLALAQAGAYMQATRRSLSSYLDLFQSRASDLLRRGSAPWNYPRTVATTWLFAFLQVQQTAPAAADLLNLCAFLGPDNIPREMLSTGAEQVPQPLREALADPLALDDIVVTLQQYSLLAATESAFSVHRLVQAVTRDQLQKESRRNWAEVAVRVMDAVFPNIGVQAWPICAQRLPHVLAAAQHGEAFQVADETTGHLLHRAGIYLQGRAQFTQGAAVLQRALAIYERVPDPDPLHIAGCMSQLGHLLRDAGEVTGARAYMDRALAIYERVLGPDHLKSAGVLVQFGFLLRDQGDLTGAHFYLERALAVCERAYGVGHAATITSLNNLGSVLQAQGDLAGAWSCFARALAVCERMLGPDQLAPGTTLSQLGAMPD